MNSKEKEYSVDVSIVIVCMNNLKNLYPCLESIRKYTTCSYEVLVTAYLFAPENLKKVREDFPWVIFIESDEIRGFSENNNLALRQAKGKYCFVLNDDTEMKMDVPGMLVNTIEKLPTDVAVLSPNVIRKDGSIQHCGRPPINMWEDMLDPIRYISKKELYSKWCNKNGVFQSYNIHGAAFLIKTKLFKEVGWFDEKYFFCPEDIALSTALNTKGYKCMVDSEISIIHLGGGTWSKTLTATKPATVRGNIIFFCDNMLKKAIYRIYWTLMYFIYIIYWHIKPNSDNIKKRTMIFANRNAIVALWSRKTPKELFCKYYANLD